MNHLQSIRFETRITQEMRTALHTHAVCLHIGDSELTRHALKTFFRRYTKGLVEYRTKSDFLMRHQPENKVRFEARLGWASREMLRRLAYSFRISQAELLRIALEYYIYCFGPQAP